MNEKVVQRLIEEFEVRREKSQKFLDMYPKLVRGGFIAIFTVPILFMILMFSVEAKLVFLVLWIMSILLIAAYLIGIEYFYFYYSKLHKEFTELMDGDSMDSSEVEDVADELLDETDDKGDDKKDIEENSDEENSDEENLDEDDSDEENSDEDDDEDDTDEFFLDDDEGEDTDEDDITSL